MSERVEDVASVPHTELEAAELIAVNIYTQNKGPAQALRVETRG